MGIINDIYDKTEILYQFLDTFPKKEVREEYIVRLNNMLDERGNMLKSLPDVYSREEEQIGKKIIILNEKINVQIEQIFKEVEDDLQQVSQKKLMHNKYSIQAITGDGMFIDKRK